MGIQAFHNGLTPSREEQQLTQSASRIRDRLVLTLALFHLTMWTTTDDGRFGGNTVWKTSSLALLYHGLGELGCNQSVDMETLRCRGGAEEYEPLIKMEEAAGSRTVQLGVSDSTGRLMLQ